LLPAPTAPSEGSAGLKDTFRRTRHQSPGSPAQASLPIKPLPRERSLDFLLDRAARKLACLSIIAPDPKVKAIRCSAALLGSITLGVPLCSSVRRLPSRVALEEDQLFRRLFPTGPEKLRRASHCLSAEIGPSVTLRFPSCRCRPSGGGGDFRPDHLLTMHTGSESRKRKMR